MAWREKRREDQQTGIPRRRGVNWGSMGSLRSRSERERLVSHSAAGTGKSWEPVQRVYWLFSNDLGWMVDFLLTRAPLQWERTLISTASGL